METGLQRLFHIQAELDVRDCQSCSFTISGVPVVYNVETQELACQDKKAPLKTVNGRVYLELIVDWTSIEIFGNHGRVYMAMGMQLGDKPNSLQMFTVGGETRIESLKVYELESIWQKMEKGKVE